MIKCVKISTSSLPSSVLNKKFIDIIAGHARKLSLEGSLQTDDGGTVKIVACGKKDNIELFIDALYREGSSLIASTKKNPFHVEVEALFKDRDYRGTFRVIV